MDLNKEYFLIKDVSCDNGKCRIVSKYDVYLIPYEKDYEKYEGKGCYIREPFDRVLIVPYILADTHLICGHKAININRTDLILSAENYELKELNSIEEFFEGKRVLQTIPHLVSNYVAVVHATNEVCEDIVFYCENDSDKENENEYELIGWGDKRLVEFFRNKFNKAGEIISMRDEDFEKGYGKNSFMIKNVDGEDDEEIDEYVYLRPRDKGLHLSMSQQWDDYDSTEEGISIGLYNILSSLGYGFSDMASILGCTHIYITESGDIYGFIEQK